MFIVLLKFSNNEDRASELMDGHKAWIQRGFEAGVFLLVGSMKPMAGGGVLAHHISLEELQVLVAEDPFVVEDVVTPEIIEISPARADERLKFLTD